LYALNKAIANLSSRQTEFDKLEDKVGKIRPTGDDMWEYCGRVCCTKGGKFYFAEATTDRSTDSCVINLTPRCLDGHIQKGGYHNHPSMRMGNDHTRFSGRRGENGNNDIGWSDRSGMIVSVAYEYRGKKAVKIYDPENGKIEIWTKDKEGKWIKSN
jgi:hypothetical protein